MMREGSAGYRKKRRGKAMEVLVGLGEIRKRDADRVRSEWHVDDGVHKCRTRQLLRR